MDNDVILLLVNMNKYLRYLGRIGLLSTLRMMSYKLDLMVFFVLTPIFTFLELLSIYLVFYAGNIQTIMGYNLPEILFVSMLGVSIFYICGISTVVNDDIEESILHGRLDFFLLKPISPTFQLCFRQVYIEGIFILCERGLLLLLITYLGGLSFSLIEFFQLCFVIITSVFLQTCMLLMVASANFYFPKGAAGLQEFLLTLIQTTQEFPKEIYPQWFQTFSLRILPIFLITQPAFQILHHAYTISTALYTLLMCGIFCIFAILLWKRGLRLYQSTN